MGFRFQRITCQFLALCASIAFALAAAPARADDFTAEQVAQKFTPSVMLVFCTSSSNPNAGVLGTGYVLSEDGIVCTNYHVIDGQDKIVLRSFTGGTYDVTAILATDKKHDIALLKIDAHKLTPLELANSDNVAAGQKVFVIGNPEGLESSITEGIVSSKRDEGPDGPCIQISAAISHGSSGSPVFNGQGKVIGMATFNLGDGQALNFAIPSNAVAALLATAKNPKPADAAAATPAPSTTGALYEPDPAVHGSKTQDAAVFKDTRYAKLKDAENIYDCFAMLSLAKQLVKDYPDSSAASRALGDSYFYASMPDEAFKAARRAIDLAPDSGRAWDILAILYYNYTSDSDTPAAIYAHAIELAPDDVKLLIEYAGIISATARDTAKSALTHAKNLLLDDNGYDIETQGYHLKSALVTAYVNLGLYSDAYDTALELLKKTTTDPWLYLAYADAAEHDSQNTYVKSSIDKALSLDLFKQALKLDSRDFSTLSDLVYVISNKPKLAPGDYQDLDYYISELKSINPKAAKTIEDKAADTIRQNSQ